MFFESFRFGFIFFNSFAQLPDEQKGPMGDGMGQQYTSPEAVIGRGNDVIIVGRGILQHPEGPAVAAQKYQNAGWEAYEKKTEK
mmetsp:Transcript_40092/g.55765  ORF Transcript_40092/g.55765 Transcript_40092/m.55765 type:complete len:84 (-) Transcript_40092:143-394(-)